MRMRVLRRKLTAMAVCAVSAGTLLVTAAVPASAAETAEFGVRLQDPNENGQCRVETDPAGDVTSWAPINTWTRYLAIDTDDRLGGCSLWFGLNNADGSLNGMQLSYTYTVNPGGDAGQCQYQSSTPRPIRYFPLAMDWPVWIDPPIGLHTDDRHGYCNLKLSMSGRNDIGLDVRYWYVEGTTSSQCINASQASPQQFWTVRTDHPVEIGLNTDDSGGACFLAFRLRNL